MVNFLPIWCVHEPPGGLKFGSVDTGFHGESKQREIEEETGGGGGGKRKEGSQFPIRERQTGLTNG